MGVVSRPAVRNIWRRVGQGLRKKPCQGRRSSLSSKWVLGYQWAEFMSMKLTYRAGCAKKCGCDEQAIEKEQGSRHRQHADDRRERRRLRGHRTPVLRLSRFHF